MTRDELKKMYHGNPVTETIKKLGISRTWLYMLLKEHDIPKKGYAKKVTIEKRRK